MFNDARFSADGSISCASCHHPDKAFTNGKPVAQGLNGQFGTRNAPTIINAAFYECLFLDGRANSLEDQALGPFVSPVEHGLKNHQAIVDIVKHDPMYIRQFNTVFAIRANGITVGYVAKVIASYELDIDFGRFALRPLSFWP